MTPILNENKVFPKNYVYESFKNECSVKTLIHAGSFLYRIVSKEDTCNDVKGSNFLTGEFWIDHETFLMITSKVNYKEPLKSITDVSRRGLAITSQFSQSADTMIGVTLLQNVYGWKGITARKFEIYKNGMKQIYQGGLTQLWIPNLNDKIVSYRFMHTI